MKLHFFILICLFSTGIISCKKNNKHPVPNIPFDININIDLPTYNNLTGVGGSAYVNGGSKGIVVYRRSIHEFVAFDRHSPAEEGSCEQALVIDSTNTLQLNDLCSGARFSLYDGSPISDSEYGLRMYATQFDGNSNLRIFN